MTHVSSPSAHLSSSPTPREVDRDSRTAAAGTGLRRQPSFTERRLDYLLDEARGFLDCEDE